MSPAPGGALADAAELLPVEHGPEYVVGCPVHVALTMRARPNAALQNVHFPDFVDLREAVGLEMYRQGGSESVRYSPQASLPDPEELPGEALASGETRRMLVDISPLVGQAIPAGSYYVRLSLAAAGELYSAPPVTLRFRAPTTEEAVALASAAPNRAQAANWALWMTTCTAQSMQLHPALLPGHPLLFMVLLHRLFCAPDPPERVDPAMLDSLTGLYAPERDALKAELMQVQGSPASFERAREWVTANHPGLAWWMRMLTGGGGYITSFHNPVYTVPSGR